MLVLAEMPAKRYSIFIYIHMKGYYCLAMP
jgi:hypothetical protein